MDKTLCHINNCAGYSVRISKRFDTQPDERFFEVVKDREGEYQVFLGTYHAYVSNERIVRRTRRREYNNGYFENEQTD